MGYRPIQEIVTGSAEISDGAIVNADVNASAAIAWGKLNLSGRYVEITDTSESAAVNTFYLTNNAGQVTITMPATAAVGDEVAVIGKGSGGWKIAQNAGQTIYFGDQNTTAGAGGYLESTNRRDCVSLVCVTDDSEFEVINSIGNITYV
jgi:hypothetical protein